MESNWLGELLGGDPQWLNWLDQKSRGALSLITLAGVAIGCVVVTLREYGSLWQLAPVTVVAALLVGAVVLIRWRLGVDEAPVEPDAAEDLEDK